jgi:hypothetical protein
MSLAPRLRMAVPNSVVWAMLNHLRRVCLNRLACLLCQRMHFQLCQRQTRVVPAGRGHRASRHRCRDDIRNLPIRRLLFLSPSSKAPQHLMLLVPLKVEAHAVLTQAVYDLHAPSACALAVLARSPPQGVEPHVDAQRLRLQSQEFAEWPQPATVR